MKKWKAKIKHKKEICGRQISLINHSHISTIHSFCLDVIRNNFYETNLSNNFRVGDSAEIEIMKQEVIEEIFEGLYEKDDKDFLDLLEIYTSYKDDSKLKEIVLKFYDFLQTLPFPEKWLKENIEKYNIQDDDFAKTEWGDVLVNYSKQKIDDIIKNIEMAQNELNQIIDLDVNKSLEILDNDIFNLNQINFENWNSLVNTINNVKFDRWYSPRKASEEDKEILDNAKNLRDDAKDNFNNIKAYFEVDSNQAISEIKDMYYILKKLEKIAISFKNSFSEEKAKRNVIDFSDIEHIALNLLIDENGNRTNIAKKYDFSEVLCDEYQDSSLIQEYILKSVQNGKNGFYVGDVKQSIYGFREARPENFLSKYESYSKDETDDLELKQDTKILLYKNFRSRANVLDFVNEIFSSIMSKNVGDIDYSEEEYLNLGGNFDESKIDTNTEIYVINTDFAKDEDIEKEEEQEINLSEKDKEDLKKEKDLIDNSTLEARLIVQKIKELHEKGIDYKDIAILLRAPNVTAPIYEKELIENDIPVFSDVSQDYLGQIEIDTILSFLKIIDNPLQDIPLVTVLRSPIVRNE